MYRSYLFGSPTIITCSPASNKFVLQSAEDFRIVWPAPELVGRDSIINAEGKQHSRLRGFILGAINQPDSLADCQNGAATDGLRASALGGEGRH